MLFSFNKDCYFIRKCYLSPEVFLSLREAQRRSNLIHYTHNILLKTENKEPKTLFFDTILYTIFIRYTVLELSLPRHVFFYFLTLEGGRIKVGVILFLFSLRYTLYFVLYTILSLREAQRRSNLIHVYPQYLTINYKLKTENRKQFNNCILHLYYLTPFFD